MKSTFPQSVKACLWSYDIDLLDITIPDHRTRIIHNVLEYGTSEALAWLFDTFSHAEIAQNINMSSSSQWSKKSLSLWSLVFNARPRTVGRFE
jgi:hypothetical protein